MTPPEISEAQWQPHLIVDIEDREFRFKPRELGVAPQHLGADRVKRAEPLHALDHAPISAPMRSFISRAALLVKVTARIWPGQARHGHVPL